MLIKRILYLLALLVLPAAMFAQVTTSSMSGSVKSQNGEALVGATVIAKHLPTGTSFSSVTRTGGRFDIPNMNPGGPYEVTITYVGFKEQKRSDIIIPLGDEYRLNVAMIDQNSLQEVVVSTSRVNRVLKSGAATSINNRQINTLPTIARSINDFTRLTPQGGNASSFNGRDSRFNNISIDGANFNNNFGLSSNNLPGGDAQPISLDAIEEISVNISPFDVKQGNFTGAGINAVTRSGTNDLKGSIYTFYRDESFNGKNAGSTKLGALDKSQTKIYGGRLGGPIIKNKLFFFVNAEKETRSYPGLNWLASRPGVDPSNPNVTRVTAADLDAVSNYVRSQYQYETGVYEGLGNFESENTKLLGRIDWSINNNHRVSLRYNRVKSTNDQETNGTSAPNPRGSSNRWSKNAMAYSNANYGFEDIVSSWTLDLRSKLSARANNQFLATYTNIETNRTSGSSPFPFIDIQDGNGDQYISLGYELFSYRNAVKNKVYTFANNFSYSAGKHTLTAGAAFDRLYFGNSFLRYGTSYYRFSSLNDFLTNQAPNAFALTYGYNGTEPIAELTFGQLAVYLQDEIKVNDNFKLLAGVRVDKALYLKDPAGNSAIAEKTFRNLDGQAYKFDMASWPKSKLLWSPRVGFNWDIYGNRDMIIRGGSGIFTGRLPFVWYTNQPTNSYALQATVERTGSAAASFLFNPDPKAYANQFPQSPNTLPSGASIAQVDKDFVFPQVWRTSLAIDKKLPWDLLLTLEAIYTKDINAIFQYNANLAAPDTKFASGPDQRPRYSGSGARSVDASVREAMVLSNTSRGNGMSYSMQLVKSFKNGFYGQVGYSLNHTMDLSANPGSQAASAWSNINSVRSNNDLDLSISQYSLPHRFSAGISYRFEYAKSLATTISLFYEGANQGRFSYKYSNDMNNDGLTNDLLYIPTDRAEASVFIPNTADADAFWAYVEQDKYLSNHKGQYAEYNGALLPFLHRVDMRFLQDFSVKAGGKKHTMQFSLDMLNFTNFVNKNWGLLKRNVVSNGAILRYSGLSAAGVPQYTMNKVGSPSVYPTSTFETVPTASSTWGMQIGLRYIFD
ncbi:MAG: TonB-dependent receptor [Chitinophagaceae bacterium]